MSKSAASLAATELEACTQVITQLLARIERVASRLKEEERETAYRPSADNSAESAVSSRIHRETPPVIPADLASTMSRASNYGGERTRPAPAEVPATTNYMDWASSLSRVSSVSRNGGQLSRSGDVL